MVVRTRHAISNVTTAFSGSTAVPGTEKTTQRMSITLLCIIPHQELSQSSLRVRSHI